MVQSVCAIVVTYHPEAAMVENMAGIVRQVEQLAVVDNGSNAEELAMLREASCKLGFQLIENGDNLGIAEALNQGVLWARNHNFPWVVLFDQDSKITPNFMARMFATWEAHPERERIASLHPSYIQPDTGVEPAVARATDGGPVTSMTSGALMPMWIFDRIGLFSAEYFIDLVDCEYCLRIRAAGYLIADSRDAVLLHTAGHPERRTVLGFSFQPSNHSPMRRYYIARNRIVVYRKYFFRFPRWTLRSIYESVRETAKCFVAEDQRSRKMRNFLWGTWDGLVGHMGKRQGL